MTKPEKPKHIAIVMDGNGRWANQRGLPRTLGHKQGVETVKKIVREAADLGVDYITLFGFSTENWKRPETEIRDLMGLLRQYLRSETAELHRENIRLRIIGNRHKFAPDIVRLMDHAEELTKNNSLITVIIALNYGGRDDILQAVQKVAERAVQKEKVPGVPELKEKFSSFLMTDGLPDPDLLIRTSGEKRISNFLLWQCAYTEMIFTETLWPDFSRQDLIDAMDDYAQRERRFGGLRNA